MTRNMAQVSLFAVGLLMGMLLVGQLRSQARPTEISSLSAQELSQLVDTLSRPESRAAHRAERPARHAARVRGRGPAGPERAAGEPRGPAPHRRLRRPGGGEGQGISLEVEGDLDAIALNDLLNELRNAGAEALAVDDIRITARSVAVQGPTSLLIDGVPGRSPLHAAGHRLAGGPALHHRAAGRHHRRSSQQFIDASIVARQSDDIGPARDPG